MKSSWKIIIICTLMLSAGFKISAQSNIIQADSLKIINQQKQQTGEGRGQDAKEAGNIQSGKNNTSQAAKRIKNGRPDMTKARGARPPSIVRPSGSGIPKGVGRPGGAGHKIGR
jgi:hypothetical protein